MFLKLNEYAENVLERLKEVAPNGLPPERLALRLGGNPPYAQAYCEMLEHSGLLRCENGTIYFYVQQPTLVV